MRRCIGEDILSVGSDSDPVLLLTGCIKIVVGHQSDSITGWLLEPSKDLLMSNVRK
jgi:hypothetical protein